MKVFLLRDQQWWQKHLEGIRIETAKCLCHLFSFNALYKAFNLRWITPKMKALAFVALAVKARGITRTPVGTFYKIKELLSLSPINHFSSTWLMGGAFATPITELPLEEQLWFISKPHPDSPEYYLE